jgi:tRNA U54 and U55 pseudouridine synthase Pus10
VLDNTNHDLVHTLSVRLDANWHDTSYRDETSCERCRDVFARLRELDEEAIQLLSNELASHVRANKFPVDLSD